MKHKLTILTAVVALLAFMIPGRVIGQVKTDELAYTLDGHIPGGSNGYATESDIEQNGLTWKVMGNTQMDPWRIGGKNIENENRPLYSTAPMSDNIVKIDVTHGTANNITVNSMTLEVSSNPDFSGATLLTGEFAAEDVTTFNRPSGANWSGMYYRITYNVTVSGGSNRFLQFISAEFYKDGGGLPSVATPTFDPAGGTYSDPVNVTISCATSGASIRYTTDGTNPTASSTLYSSPIAVSSTTTIKAVAMKSGMNNSAIASATYTFMTPITIAEARALANNEYALIQGVVTLIDGRNVYIQDATAGIDLYLNNNTVPETLALGDMVMAYGKKTEYNGLVELTGINGNNAEEFSILSSGNPLPVAVKTIEEILADAAAGNMLQSTRVKVENALVGTINYSGNTPISQGSNTINVYKMPAVDGLQEGDNITVFAVVGYFNAPQLRIHSAADVTVSTPQDMVATPTFSPAAGAYTSAQSVTISCATAGATIRYTTNGTTPTASSTVYTQPITVNSNMTIKAIGMKSGLADSYVATAEYTIVSPMTIAEARALADNEYALVQGVVTMLDGRTIYIQDATAGIALYLNTQTVPEALALGDMVTAYGKKTVFNGLVELTGINGGNAGEFSIVSSGNTLPLVTKTIAEILADHEQGDLLQSTRVKVVDAVVGEINNANNTPISQGENTINIYKMPVVDGMIEGDNITVIAIVGCYNAAQLRVNSADDIQFSHPVYPAISVAPQSLTGFGYVAGNGPSAAQSFTITAINLTSNVTLTMSGNAFEMSRADATTFTPEATITLTPNDGAINQTVMVRLKAGLAVNSYQGVIDIASELDPLTVSLSGSVGDQSDSWNKIYTMGELTDGCQVIIAARYDAEVANGYYAMPAQVSGKPDGVLFQSQTIDNKEILPSDIVVNSSEFLWNVSVANGVVTLTNAAGASLGYSSSTNFSGNDNTGWTLSNETAGEGAMVPNYTGFRLTNAGVNVRGVALNDAHKFGAYAISNSNSATYNFFLDLFVFGGETNQTVATPVIDKPSGTYYNEIDVAISCETPGATIRYTINGDMPTANSMVYTTPIHVAGNMTIKAIAMRDGFNDSEMVSASYVIVTGMEAIVSQDWEGEMNGWTFVTVEGNKPWIIGNHNNNHYANANGYGDEAANEQWCISPVFDMTQHFGQDVILTFRNAMKYTGPALELMFSNNYDGQNPTAATWQALSFTASPGNYTWTESGEIDLSGFNGNNCYIGFKYTSTPGTDGAAAWEIDDILILAGGAVSNPVLTATPTAVNMSYIVNQGPSQAQSYALYASNLQGSGVIMALAPNHFEISLDGTNWDTELGISYADGQLLNQPVTVYVRLEGGLSVGSYSGTVEHEGGGAYAEVNLTGVVETNVGIVEGQALNAKVWNYGSEIAVENASAESLLMTVYNVLGQPVLNKVVAGESNEKFVHGLSNGMYIVELQNNNGRTVTKIVVR